MFIFAGMFRLLCVSTARLDHQWKNVKEARATDWLQHQCINAGPRSRTHRLGSCSSAYFPHRPPPPQLWQRVLPPAVAAAVPPLHLAPETQPAADDRLLGCATVDLSALVAMGSLDGWYNIVDYYRQTRGQIKVQVRTTHGMAWHEGVCCSMMQMKGRLFPKDVGNFEMTNKPNLETLNAASLAR